MDKSNKEMLKGEIASNFEKLKTIEIRSKEHKAATDDLIKLYRLAIDEFKTENEIRLKRVESKNASSRQEQELQIKREQLELERESKTRALLDSEKEFRERKIDRWIKIGTTVLEITLPLMFYAHWMRKGFKFEETGTFTSTTFRGLFSHFKPTKR